VRERPDDAAAQVAYLKLLLEDGQVAEAAVVVKRLDTVKVPVALQAEFAIAHAQLQDAAGNKAEAIAELVMLTGKPLPLDLRWQAAGTLLRNGRKDAALDLFQDAAEPEGLLMKAVLLIASGDGAQSATILDELQARRPEWSAVWVARAALQSTRSEMAEARHSLETAVALGARSSQVTDLATLLLSRPVREW
jgi:predicted Zn-dependent protease